METMTPTTRSNTNKSLIFKGISALFVPRRNTRSTTNSVFLLLLATTAFALLLTAVSDVDGAKFSGYSKAEHRKNKPGGTGHCPKGQVRNDRGKCQKQSYQALFDTNNVNAKPNRWDSVHHVPQGGRWTRRPRNPVPFAQRQQLQLVGNDYRRVYRNPAFYRNPHQPNIFDTFRRLKHQLF